MKPQEQKTEFIRLRAEGRSYSYIADTLHISKSTCSSWERELQDAIAELKQEQLNELYSSYAMTKEARVKKLGETGGYVYVVDTNIGAISFINTTLSTDITAQLKKELGITATAAAAPATPAK